VRALKKLGSGRPSTDPLVASLASRSQLEFLASAELVPLEEAP
jgi:hypothetical protein